MSAMPVEREDVSEAEGPWPLPDGWLWAQAAEFADIVGGSTPRDAANPNNYAPDGIPWITPADLSGFSGTCIARGSRSLSKHGFGNSSARMLPAGAVLFSSRAPIGYCAIASNPVCTNQGFKSLVLRCGIVPEFIRYYMLYNRRYFVDNASGTTFKELSGSALGELYFPIAPLNSQRRIVARIDELFAEIAEGEAVLERARNGRDIWRRALLKAAVTGKLTHDWREANKPTETGADILAHIRRERDAAGPKSGRGHGVLNRQLLDTASLPDLPEGWVWATIGEMFEVFTGSTPSRSEPAFWAATSLGLAAGRSHFAG
jgi:type I restriction enzyme S subunit